MSGDNLGSFAARLNNAITSSGKGEDIIALRCEMTVRRLFNLCAARSTFGPRLDEVQALAAVLGVSRDWLAFGAK